jgi:type II secretory pathway component GspD/PulD (secretin)
MKRFSIALSAMLVTAAVAQEPAAPAEEKAGDAPDATIATAEVPAAADATTMLQDEGTDEIDLEEDDSAIAAKKPQIKGEISEGTMSLVDIDCDDATLADILRQFRKTTGANIISDDSTNLQRRVSVSLRHVPWLQGLTAILGSRGFRLEPRDNIYRVIEDLQAIPVSTRTFKLNHASAKELADLFNATFAPKDQTGKIKSQIASSFVGANVVVVTATDKILSDCESIITSVDKAVDQIYIEARFIELSSEAMHSLGFDWSHLKSWGVSTKNVTAGMDLGVDKSVTVTKDGSISISDKPSGSLERSSSGSRSIDSSIDSRVNKFDASSSSDISLSREISRSRGNSRTSKRSSSADRTFSGTLSVEDFRLAISAFESIEDAKIFSNPKVIVSNGKKAKVDMTTKYPYVELTSQRNTSSENSYLDYSAKLQQIPGDKDHGLFAGSAFFSYGIELSVTPRISPDGLISVEITPSISYVDEYYSVANGSNMGADSSYGKFPIVKMKSISTEFTMKDGSTAVIGGLSKTEEEDVDDGIPYLRRIPWIGQKLFGSKSRQKVQYEIIICVTVGIAHPDTLPRDIGLPKNAILGREFVRGNQLEPGDRENAATDIITLDMTELDKRGKKKAHGTVTITPVAEPSLHEIAAEANVNLSNRQDTAPVRQEPADNDQ